MSVLESQAWYRVARLRPTLRRHVRVRRHHYRGAPWFVLEDPASGRQHRLDARAFALIGACDGRRPLGQIWQALDERLGDDAPTQDQCIALLGQLHAADLLRCDVTPDTRELFERYAERRRSQRRQAFRSPFFVRIPLYDPERLLRRCAPVGRVVFRPLFALVLLILLSGALFATAVHWSALIADAQRSLLSPLNLLLLWLVYPLVKALHEFGHALAVKHWGGEVHDTGLMVLVFMPVPYVDASAANAFESKHARMVVAGAGIAVELSLAAIALLVWLTVEPGIVRMLALDVMTIGGISTLLFNGNPLLKFDGYYVLADWLEIPNLASRSANYYGYLARRYLLGIRDARSPVRARGERRWFAFYGFASFVYRMFILAAILLFIAGVSRVAAVVLGAWAIGGQLLLPLVRKLSALAADPVIRERAGRVALVGIGACALIGALAVIPAPQRTRAVGVVFNGEDTRVRAGVDCFVQRLLAAPGQRVAQGEPLVECADPQIGLRLALLEARVEELRARHVLERSRDRAQAQIVAEEIDVEQARLDDARRRASELIVRSPAPGVFYLPVPEDLPGRFVAQGEVFADIVDGTALGVRMAVRQTDIALVREDTQSVEVRFAGADRRALPARIRRIVPGATRALPSAALTTAGGGPIVADPTDAGGSVALEPYFLVDLDFEQADAAALTGRRAEVRVTHSPATPAQQAWRALRQLLLSRLAL